MSPHVELDRASLLARVDARATLGECEDALRKDGLTLGLEPIDRALAVGAWLAVGAPGSPDPWSDPADHLIAGLDVTMKDGRALSIRPSPRRAVGPDLVALVFGMQERFAKVERAWLRVHPLGVPRPKAAELVAERNPPLGDGEEALLRAIDQELRG